MQHTRRRLLGLAQFGFARRLLGRRAHVGGAVAEGRLLAVLRVGAGIAPRRGLRDQGDPRFRDHGGGHAGNADLDPVALADHLGQVGGLLLGFLIARQFAAGKGAQAEKAAEAEAMLARYYLRSFGNTAKAAAHARRALARNPSCAAARLVRAEMFGRLGWAIEAEAELARVLEDLPTFTGIDARNYTLKAEDVVTLPLFNARILLESGAVERIGGD